MFASDATSTHLSIRESVSRGMETYGYNIVTLTDDTTGKKFRAMGGGYDMLGTVVADWLMSTYPELALGLSMRADATYVHGFGRVKNSDSDADDYDTRAMVLYGLTRIVHADNTVTMSLDGACGISSVHNVAAAMGVTLTRDYNKRGHTTGYQVSATV